jgi:hypothetical protein
VIVLYKRNNYEDNDEQLGHKNRRRIFSLQAIIYDLQKMSSARNKKIMNEKKNCLNENLYTIKYLL